MDLESSIQPPMRIQQILTVPEDESDLPSQFGDDDALLSVTHSDTSLSLVQTSPTVAHSKRRSDSTITSSMATSGLRTSELRRERSMERNWLKRQNEDSISSQRRKDFNLEGMGLVGREEETAILRSSLDRILFLQSKIEAPISDEDDLDVAKHEIVLLGGPSG